MRDELFEKAPIPKAVVSLALPTMIGMIVTVVYNMADTFFVGRLNDANQVAAVSITMPVFLLLMAIGNMFGVGGGSYISRLLGRKDKEKTKKVSAFCFYGAMVVGVICIVLALIFMPQICTLAGTSENTYGFAKDYLTVIAYGAPAVILSFSLGQIVRAEGAATQSLKGMMLGTILNIILDPILIIVLGYGVKGAAIATIFANVVSMLYYAFYIVKKSRVLSIAYKDFSLNRDIMKNIFTIGIPASLNNMLMSFAAIILNNFAMPYGENVVAALGVVSKASMLPAMLCVGLATGIQPLVAYNYSSGNLKRMKNIIKFAAVISTTIGCIGTAVLFIGSNGIIKGFINDPQVVELGSLFIKMSILGLSVVGIQMILINTFQAIGKAKPSLILSLCRQGLVYIPMLFLLNKFVGQNGLSLAQSVADIGSAALAATIFIIIMKKESNAQSLEETELSF